MQAQLPPGTYFIGDPCYAISDEDWPDFLEPYWNEEGEFEFKDHVGFAASTAFGDGTFTGSDGIDYGVDAGMLGAVPKELWGEYDEEALERMGAVVTFDEVWTASCDGMGTFMFDTVEIQTGDDNPSDFDPDDDEYYDDVPGADDEYIDEDPIL